MIDMQKGANIAEMPLVSIIVPVYKVEPYLDRCIKSIIAQTYKNIEVFLVDDGSPDNCGRMCDEYAKRYQFISVIHQVNQGQAAARNIAMQIATGEYVLFVDSDDYITEDHVEYLVNLQIKYGADITIGGTRYLYEGKTPPEYTAQAKEYVLTASEALSRMNYGQGFGAVAWAKLLRRDIVKKHPFPEGKIYEDLATMYQMIGDSARVVFGEKIIYFWIQRTNSTTRSHFDERQWDAIEAAEHQLIYVEKRFPEVVPAARARYVAKIIELVGIAIRDKENKKIFFSLKDKMRYNWEFLGNINTRISQKVRCLAIMLGYYPSRVVFCLHDRLKEKIY